MEAVKRKAVLGIPNFKKQMPRSTLLPGQSMGMIDPSGHGFIDESRRGLEGQNYGMAAYKKGLQ